MKKAIYLLLFFIWAIPSSFAQLKTYSFEEVEQLSKENPKPIVVFIHTNWCKFCKIMKNTTFKDPKITTELNENFYFISFDAESKKEIIFNNHKFQFQPNGTNIGIHELATALATTENQVVYPTLTILARDNSILFQQASFISAKALWRILDKLK